MLNSRLIGAVALTFSTALGASAQISDAPAEFPPASYTANQYVDSNGCAFIRAGVGGTTTWVPRVARDRNQLCGFQPSLAQAPAAAPAPVVTPVQASAPVTAPTPAPVAAAPRPASNVGDPIPTVAGLTTPPVLRVPASPAVVPMPVAAPVAAAPAPTLTRADVCEGRSGVQRNYISERTGQPIDCGPGAAILQPAVFSAPAPTGTIPAGLIGLENAPRMTRAEACVGRFGYQRNFISERTGQPIDCGPPMAVSPTVLADGIRLPGIVGPYGAASAFPPGSGIADPYPGIRRATLSEVCEEISLTGARFVNVVTGQRVTCEAVPLVMARGPLAPGAPQPVGGPSVPGLTTTYAQAAVRVQNAQPQSVGAAVRQPSVLSETLSPSPIPASNPVAPLVQHVRPPAGYERVWEDGRINLNRGVPQEVSGQVVQSRTLSRTPVAAPAPQATAPSYRFIQVGTYGEAANADAAAARLRGMGLPIGFASITSGGQPLRVVAAGPFTSAAQLNAALQAVRAAGYGDAFARN